MKVVAKKLSELREATKNIRKHTDKQITEYVRSIEMFGQIKPLVIDEDGEIIAGNGLYRALMKMGKETCDCYVVEGLTPAQKKKLMLADNRVYELGITDVSAFEEIVLELNGDVDIPGWDEDLLSMMNASMPDIDEMVTSYGSYTQEEVERISERKAPDDAAGNGKPVTQETADASSSTERQFVTCPHCGQRIPI